MHIRLVPQGPAKYSLMTKSRIPDYRLLQTLRALEKYASFDVFDRIARFGYDKPRQAVWTLAVPRSNLDYSGRIEQAFQTHEL